MLTVHGFNRIAELAGCSQTFALILEREELLLI